MSVISAKDAAKKWGISQRRVAALCSDGRIPNAQRVGNMWVIPSEAEKPIDGRHLRYTAEELLPIKPFLKWAGGKGQLLSQIQELYPFEDTKIKRYAEPFIGGGAVLFDILSKYELDEVYISDINAELINTYRAIRDDVDGLINFLKPMEEKFIPIEIEERKEYFYKQRDRFNELKSKENNNVDFEKAALMIFLNKTCFNGLYRVNKKGLFNVPMGGYKNPTICDEKNLRAVSERLQNVNIVHGDYKQSESFIDSNTFVYFDPPYRPITESASFTAYTEYDFNDKEQIELAEFVNKINDKGAKIVVSNSDPKNTDENDDFFDEIYSSHSIKRVDASRMINSNGAKRGKIKELLISNF
jgi:DNA adenine methylase